MKTTWTRFFKSIVRVSAIGTSALLASATNYAMAASDNAGNAPYADGWQTTDNGGTGFGPWTLTATAGGVNSIDFAPANADNQLGAPAFSLASDSRPYYYDTNTAHRAFTGGLGVGNTFSIDVDGPLSTSPTGFGGDSGSGIGLQNAAGEELLSIYNVNAFLASQWLVADGGSNNNTPIFSDVNAAKGFNLKMSAAPLGTYAMMITSFDPTVNGGLPFLFTGNMKNPAGGQAVDSLHVFTYGTGLANPLYLNNLLTAPGVVPEPISITLLFVGGFGVMTFSARRKK